MTNVGDTGGERMISSMNRPGGDVLIVGAGPVGSLWRTIWHTSGPVQAGRTDSHILKNMSNEELHRDAGFSCRAECQIFKERAQMNAIPKSILESDLRITIQRSENNLQMMHRYFDALFGKDLNVILDMIDENIEWLIVPTGDTLRGKAAIAKLAPNHWAASPDRVKTIVNVFAGEEYASLEYRTAGTLDKQADFPSLKIDATGKRYDFQCSFVFHIVNGKIDRVHEYFDMDTVKRQLGGGASPPDTENFRQKINNEHLKQGSTATPFSTFFWAALKDDWNTADAQFADDIEWDMMPNNQIRKGKADVLLFLKASKYASKKEPIPISNRADKEWGVWEYWNVGTIDKGMAEFAKQSKWPFPADVNTIIGKKYKVPVCFIYHINVKGQIDLVREYLDVGSVIAQLNS